MSYFKILASFLLLLAPSQGSLPRLSQCGGDISSDADSLSYPPPGEPLIPGETCVWTIHLETRTNFRFAISNLSLASNFTDCRDGALRFYSLTNLSPVGAPETLTFCDVLPPAPVIFLPNSVVILVLHVGPNNMAPGAGFNLSWTATNSDPVGTRHLTSFTTAAQGVVKYPVVGAYEPNLAATWLIKTVGAGANTRSDFSLEGLSLGPCSHPSGPCFCDAVILYIVEEEGGRLNETKRFCGDSPSTDFLSNIGSRWILAFFTDGQVEMEAGGFEVIYYPTGDTVPTSTSATTVTTTPTTTTTTTTDPITGRVQF